MTTIIHRPACDADLRKWGCVCETPLECGCDDDRFCDAHRPCCGAGGSTPHWVGCPSRGWAPGELQEAFGR